MIEGKESFGRRLLRSAAQFSAGQFVAMVAGIARVALAGRFLSADTSGLWLGMQLVLSYGANLHLGSVYGLFRNLPILRVQGKDDAVGLEKSTTFVFSGLMSLASSVPLFLFMRYAYAAELRQLVATVALVAFSLFRSYYNAIFRGEKRFKELASGMAWGAGVSILSLALIPRLRLDGVLLSMGAQSIVETGYLAVREHLPGLTISLRVLKEQVRVGFMTLLAALAFLLLTTVDRTVMIQRLGTAATGQYYIGANMMLLMPVVIAMPSTVLTPQFFERVGRGEDVAPLVERPLRLAALVFAFIVGMGTLLVDPAVSILWPKLTAGNDAAIVALGATFPLVLAGLVSNVYFAHDRQALQLAITLCCAGLGFGLAHAGISLTHSITGAAVGAALGIGVYFPLSTLGAYWILGRPREAGRVVASAFAPLAYAGLIAVPTELLLRRHVPAPVPHALLGTVVGGFLLAPLLLRARRDLRAGLRDAA